MYAEAILRSLRDALRGVNEGIRVGGRLIKATRFADDYEPSPVQFKVCNL